MCVRHLGVILELDAASLLEAHLAENPLGKVAQPHAVGLDDALASSKVNRRPNYDV